MVACLLLLTREPDGAMDISFYGIGESREPSSKGVWQHVAILRANHEPFFVSICLVARHMLHNIDTRPVTDPSHEQTLMRGLYVIVSKAMWSSRNLLSILK